MRKRHRVKQTQSLQDRLSEFIATARQEADGPARDALLTRIQKAENASNMEAWASSPELQPPK